MSYKVLVKWDKRQQTASTICRNIDDVLSDVDNFLTGEFGSGERDDSVVKIVIRRTTLEEDVELMQDDEIGVTGRDVINDDEAI
jgi:hypothetical protein